VLGRLLRQVLSPRNLGFGLTLCSILVGGLVSSGSQVWAAEGGGQVAGEAPTIANLSVSGIGEHEVTMEAQINPEGLETTYEMWLEYRDCQNIPPGGYQCESISEARVEHGQLPAGNYAQIVRATRSDLQPGYSYSYWVLATSSAGRTESLHRAFNTFSEGAVPASSETDPASTITSSDGPTSGDGVPGTLGTSGGSGAASSTSSVTATPLSSSHGKAKVLTQAQKLSNALRACKRKSKKQRADCARRARKKYGLTRALCARRDFNRKCFA
jgi:hypothetical protein